MIKLLRVGVLVIVNIVILLRHPVWMARTAWRVRRIPNIARPLTYREKRIWRLIFDHNPAFVPFGDKQFAKNWMIERAPALKAAELPWIGEDASQLPPDLLDQPVVVKAVRGCFRNAFFPASPEDRERLVAQCTRWAEEPYVERLGARYWPRIRPGLMVERKIDAGPGGLLDLTIFCCDGVALFVGATLHEKTPQEQIAIFTEEGERVRVEQIGKRYRRVWLPDDFRLPASWPQARAAAETLSQGFDYMRADIMCAGDDIYPGEMTPYPGVGLAMEAGYMRQRMEAWDISGSWSARTPQSGLKEVYRRALIGADLFPTRWERTDERTQPDQPRCAPAAP